MDEAREEADNSQLQGLFLDAVMKRRPSEEQERLDRYLVEAFGSLGSAATEEQIAAASLSRLKAEEPTLAGGVLDAALEANIAAMLIGDGYTLDVEGRITPLENTA